MSSNIDDFVDNYFKDKLIYRPAPYYPFSLMDEVISFCSTHNIAIASAEGFYRVGETGIQPDGLLIVVNDLKEPISWNEMVMKCNENFTEKMKEWESFSPDLVSIIFASEELNQR